SGQDMTKNAADLTRVSSQPEEENKEPENDDGYSGGTHRESQVATALRIRLSLAEFGRNVLSTLFANNELATHTMPPLHRHKRRPTDPPTLDADKIDILKTDDDGGDTGADNRTNNETE
ncbi:unnamed protein product, partial [Didymodactylos carnosus]